MSASLKGITPPYGFYSPALSSATFVRLMTWTRDITRDQWRTLFAAQLGWMLDAMDVMLYSFALTAVRAEFQLTSAAAGTGGRALSPGRSSPSVHLRA